MKREDSDYDFQSKKIEFFSVNRFLQKIKEKVHTCYLRHWMWTIREKKRTEMGKSYNNNKKRGTQRTVRPFAPIS